MHFGFPIDWSGIDVWDIDLSDKDLDLLDTDIPSKHFVCLQDVLDTSLRHVLKTSSRHVFKTSLRHALKTSSGHVFMASWHVFFMGLRKQVNVFEKILSFWYCIDVEVWNIRMYAMRICRGQVIKF